MNEEKKETQNKISKETSNSAKPNNANTPKEENKNETSATATSTERPYEIDFKKFFKDILIPMTPPEIVLSSVKILLPGDTKASDFEEIIDKEAEQMKLQEQEQKILSGEDAPRKRPKQTFKSLFFMLVNSMGLANEVSDIRHAIAVLGILQVRNAIMGMSLYQHFNPKLSLRFDKIAGGEIEKPIKFALEAEEFSKQNRCPGHLAFIGGLFFDLIRNIIINKKASFDKLQDGPLKKPDEVIEAIWRHSLAVSFTSNFLLHKCKARIHLGRFASVAGLLHDLGKLALIAYAPDAYNEILKKRKETLLPFSELEEETFNFPHETISALVLRKLNIFTEIELPIDHHHENDILAIRNPDMHRLAALIEISDALVHKAIGFMGIELDTDFNTIPARLVIKLEKMYIQEAIDAINKIKFT